MLRQERGFYAHLNTLRVLAKALICPRTTSMPRSSDALSWSQLRAMQSTHLEHIVPERLAVQALRQRHNCRRLACTGRSIEQEVRQLIGC